jgi:chromosome segregation ATPase
MEESRKSVTREQHNGELQQKDEIIKSLDDQLKQKDVEVEEKVAIVRKRDETISALKETINTKTQDIKKTEEEPTQRIEEQAKQRQQEIAKITAKLEATREELNATRVTNAAELKSRDEMVQDHKTLLQQRDNEINQVREDLKVANTKLKYISDTNETLIEENDNFQDELEDLLANTKGLQKDNQEKDDKIADLTKSLEDCKIHQQNTETPATNEPENDGTESLQDQADEDGAYVADLKGQVDDLKDQLGEKDEKIAALEKNLKDCEEHRQQSQDSQVNTQDDDKRRSNAQGTQTGVDAPTVSDSKDGEIERLRQQLEECQEHGRGLQNDFDRLFLESQGQVEGATQSTPNGKKIRDLNNILKRGQARVREVKEQNTSLEDEKRNLTLRLQEAQDLLVAQNTASGDKVTALRETELDHYRKNVKDLTAALRQAKSDLEACQTRVKELKDDVQKLIAAGSAQVTRLKSRAEELKNCQKHGEELAAKITVLEKEKNELTAQLQAAQKQATSVNASEDANKDNHGMIEELKVKLDKTQTERNNHVAYLESHLRNSTEDLDARVRQVKDLKQQNEKVSG